MAPPDQAPFTETPDPTAGATADDQDDRIEIVFDAEGRIAEDLACRSCGYNLRGLRAEDRCPECRTAIGRSVHGDLLRFCDPDWVDRVSRGLQLWVIAIVAGIIFGAVTTAGLIAAALGGIPGAPVLVLLLTGVGLITLFNIYATWQITAPDPGSEADGTQMTLRAAARWGLILSAVTGGVVTVIESEGGLTALAAPTTAAGGAHVLLKVGTLITGMIGMACLFVYAKKLALRIPDDKLAQGTRTVMWGYLITGGAMQVLGILSKMIPMTTGPLAVVIALLVVVVILPGLVFWIWGIVLVFKFRNRLTTIAAQARATWARPL